MAESILDSQLGNGYYLFVKLALVCSGLEVGSAETIAKLCILLSQTAICVYSYARGSYHRDTGAIVELEGRNDLGLLRGLTGGIRGESGINGVHVFDSYKY